MAVRSTMASLITLVRALINDPAGVAAQFSDESIQEQMDCYRSYESEILKPCVSADGATQLKFQSEHRYWESDVAITDSAGTALSPLTSDPKSGWFIFSTSQLVVRATGFCYDVYAAGAELLTLWAGRIEQDIIKFSADGSSYEFEGLGKNKLKLAAEYKAKSPYFNSAKTVRMVRDDFTY